MYGSAQDTFIYHGGSENLLSGGGEYYTNDYGKETISAGGYGYYDAIESGGVKNVYGVAYLDTIYSNGVENVYPTLPSPFRSAPAGSKISNPAAVAITRTSSAAARSMSRPAASTTIPPSSMADLENVLLGGESEFAYIYSGGMLNDRGLASGDTVYGGGVLTVFAGGVDSAGVVSSGGNAFVSLGGTVTGETVGRRVDGLVGRPRVRRPDHFWRWNSQYFRPGCDRAGSRLRRGRRSGALQPAPIPRDNRRILHWRQLRPRRLRV